MHRKTPGLVVCLMIAITPGIRADAPAFEIADVHASAPSGSLTTRGGFLRGGRYELYNATMVDLIAAAWGIDPEKVAGGPPWLDTARFDVIARTPAGTNTESLRLMLQALLAARFHLVVHPDTRPFAEYAITAGNRPKLRPAASGGESGCQPVSNAKVSCRGITMAQFADRLPKLAGDYFQGNPVVDLTRLEGTWDFTLEWTRRNAVAAGGVSIHDAIEKQLGLKVDVRNVPMPVIAVDNVSQRPTENPPGVSQTLRPVPAAFEVAVIKPSSPGVTERSMRIEPDGRIDLRGFPLRTLIKFAWDFQDNDVRDNDDMLAEGPKWLETERFDIVARPGSPGISPGPSGGTPVDLDSIHTMLRALLKDRFKLLTHTETRPVAVFALVADKPKLQQANSWDRTGCRNAPVLLAANTVAAPVFSVACRHTTMAQLAERLQPMGGIYIPHPVIDATGLAGAWNFVLSWSPPHLIQPYFPPNGEAGAAEPNGGLTLVEALHKQLGLKLKLEEHPMPVLVIDHVEPKPVDN